MFTSNIGKVYPDRKSTKGAMFATIEQYQAFSSAVVFKKDGEYYESIPETKKKNYWRDGVRKIDRETFESIVNALSAKEIAEPTLTYNSEQLNDTDNGLESGCEGKKKERFVTAYERNPKLRKQAIAIHGETCVACKFNFGEFYGDYAEGYIHIHHRTPVSEFNGSKSVNPETDLVPLCANCHSVVHRKKNQTLSVEELINKIKTQRQHD